MAEQRSHRCPCGKLFKTSSAMAQHQADSTSHHGPKAREKPESKKRAINQVSQRGCWDPRDDVLYVPFTESVYRSSPALRQQPVRFVKAKSAQGRNEKKQKENRQKLEQADALASSSETSHLIRETCDGECGWCTGCLDTLERWAETVDDAAAFE